MRERGKPAHSGPCREVPPDPTNTRFFGVYHVDAERYGRDFSKLGQEILAQIAGVNGVNLDITVEIHAKKLKDSPTTKSVYS